MRSKQIFQVHIEFSDGQDKIELEGPPDDVEAAQKALEEITSNLRRRMTFAEIDVEQKYHSTSSASQVLMLGVSRMKLEYRFAFPGQRKQPHYSH